MYDPCLVWCNYSLACRKECLFLLRYLQVCRNASLSAECRDICAAGQFPQIYEALIRAQAHIQVPHVVSI